MSTAPVLPAIATRNAPLPQMYEEARQALAECSRVDECKDWADKAQALASYARQADDDTLEKLALRIRARAIERAGKLLKEFQVEKGVGRPRKNGAGTRPISQSAAAKSAGMSRHQEKTAVRVASVPKEEFEALVESDDPPTVTQLAERGRKRREPSPEDEKRASRGNAYAMIGKVIYFADVVRGEKNIEHYTSLLAEHPEEFYAVERSKVKDVVRACEQVAEWLPRFLQTLKDKVAHV